MKSSIASVIACALISSIVSAQTTAGTSAAQLTAIDALLVKDGSWDGAGEDTPGCSAAIKHRGRLIYNKSHGRAIIEHGVPNAPATVFDPASVAKSFTATSILLLVQDGKLSLADDIRKHIPEMPDYGDPITIDQMLTHTSGIRDWGAVALVTGLPRAYRVHTNLDVLD